jgi:uncharacterized protein (AIM24 family)
MYAPQLPPGWEMKTAPDGRPYYVDHATQQTSWTPPPMPAPSPHMSAPVPLAAMSASTDAGHKHNSVHNTQDFIALARQQDAHDPNKPTFTLPTEHMLEIQIKGKAFVKLGSMAAYRGQMKFERNSKAGLSTKIMSAMTGEGAKLMKVEGQGRCFVCDNGKKLVVLKLGNEDIVVNGDDLVALEESVKWSVCAVGGAGSMSGGLFHIKVTGPGYVCVGTHFDPMVFAVSPDNPLITDPQCTVCWSGSLQPSVKADVSLKTLLGKGSGETFQMSFNGNGFVVVQPFEEVPPQQPKLLGL